MVRREGLRTLRCAAVLLPAVWPAGRLHATQCAAGTAACAAAAPRIQANDNTRPAGRSAGGVVTLRLVAREGRWYPEAADGPSIVVQALAEEAGPPVIPGPLLRVRAGTRVRVVVRNALPDTLVMRGLHDHPAADAAPVAIAPGASREIRFRAGEPGTYFYWATTTEAPDDDREGRDSQLAGAFIVDPAAGPARADRVFVMGAFSEPLDTAQGLWREALVINGRSWPHTERLAAAQGDTLEWRIINANDRPHPMHLHGFYYEVLSLGDARRDTAYAPGARPQVVTQVMRRWTTMRVAFVPHTPGTWIFHCHILFHIESGGLDPRPGGASPHLHGMDDMRGLVLGLDVRRTAPARAVAAAPRRLRVLVQARPRVYGDSAGYGFVVQDDAEPAGDSIMIPGAPLVLVRGEPVAITVVNRLPEATSVHWHGIELESFFDGVAGISGMPGRAAPMIAPGDSFVAHMTPPRAGTFIYHTHLNDIAQIARGLYGPIIVLEPGETFDPATDHVWLYSQTPALDAGPVLLNGRDSGHAPLMLRAGVPNRIRIVGMPAAMIVVATLVRGDSVVTWRALAKDGANLPPAAATPRPASQQVAVGETYDFVLVPRAGDRLTLRLNGFRSGRTLLTVPVHAH